MDAEIPARTVEIKLDEQEVIAIDLDGLDRDPEDLLLLLKEGAGSISVWDLTNLASEYWRRGWLDAAEKICQRGIECMLCFYYLRFLQQGLNMSSFETTFFKDADSSSLPIVYALHANIQLMRS